MYKIKKILENEGLEGLNFRIKIRFMNKLPQLWKIINKQFPTRSKIYKKYKKLFENKKGIEFGGKSNTFNKYGLLPIYMIADNIDNCNFGKITYWEGHLKVGFNFNYNQLKKPGYQFVSEASDLKGQISSNSYDFIISCHMLEHSANPIKVLKEWQRILKEEGIMLIILPHKEATFDHKRPVTTLAHMIADFEKNVGEDDLTHLNEIILLHDIEADGFLEKKGEERKIEFKNRATNNYENRMIHHHVFDTNAAIQLIEYTGLEIIEVEPCRINNIIIICRKKSKGGDMREETIKNQTIYNNKMSPFVSDREYK